MGTLPAEVSGAQVKKVRRVGLLGFGAIGKAIVNDLQKEPSALIEIVVIYTRARQAGDARALCEGTQRFRGVPTSAVSSHVLVTDRWEQFLAADIDLVIEAASQSAVVEHAQAVLERGCDLQVLSIGALADSRVRDRLLRVAQAADRSICVPCGALAGFDGLLAMRRSGLVSVKYTSIKPPPAWRGTIAERTCVLWELREPRVLFRGNATEAALSYPQNANLAAAVALAGAGFEATQVELIADPNAIGNTGRLQAVSRSATLDLTLSSQGFGNNLKTSQITAVSVRSSIENSLECIKFT